MCELMKGCGKSVDDEDSYTRRSVMYWKIWEYKGKGRR